MTKVLGVLHKELGAETNIFFLLPHTHLTSNIWGEFNSRIPKPKSKWTVGRESTIFKKKRGGRQKV